MAKEVRQKRTECQNKGWGREGRAEDLLNRKQVVETLHTTPLRGNIATQDILMCVQMLDFPE